MLNETVFIKIHLKLSTNNNKLEKKKIKKKSQFANKGQIKRPFTYLFKFFSLFINFLFHFISSQTSYLPS